MRKTIAITVWLCLFFIAGFKYATTLDGRMGPNTKHAKNRYICDVYGQEAYRKASLMEVE